MYTLLLLFYISFSLPIACLSAFFLLDPPFIFAPACKMLPFTAPRRRDPPSFLQIVTPPPDSSSLLAVGDSPPSSESDSLHLPSQSKPRSLRNMNKLSLTLPSATSSTNSLSIAVPGPHPHAPVEARRRPSVVSLPTPSTATAFLRSNEGDSPSVPYADGPIEILPNIWLGSEDNARDWRGLVNRGIKSVLNVAKEVACPFDSTSKPLRPSLSTPNLNDQPQEGKPIYFSGHVPSGRPGMHYLKLPWSHGQPDLVNIGLPAAFSFVDEALARGDGILIHCQCGISRSGTLIIALVMRAAARCSLSVPAEVWALKGMQGAYSYVKEKSKHVGPNMSLIYQLLDYERSLKDHSSSSPTPSDRSSNAAVEEEEWGRRRAMMDESSDLEDNDGDGVEIAQEARALDKAMEDRVIARKSSASSVASSGIGMGAAWKSRYGGRNRAGSVASNLTNGSILSENLLEEDEEQELLGVGGGFDEESHVNSPESQCDDDGADSLSSMSSFPSLPPPSAPATRSTFVLPRVPVTATQATFDLKTARARTLSKNRHRPSSITILPPVPASPIVPVGPSSSIPLVPRARVESRKPDIPSFRLHKPPPPSQPLPTPSQTLFVFPPSANISTQAPSTMILTPTPTVSTFVPFPIIPTPRRKSPGRRTSFIGVGQLATPTTAYSRVDARGWVGMD